MKTASVHELRRRGYFAIRLPASAGLPAGTPDVLVLLPPNGRAMFLEYKVGKEPLSRLQGVTGLAIVATGAAYAVVRASTVPSAVSETLAVVSASRG